MEVRLEREAAIIETILFLESEPLEEAAIARISGLSRDVVDQALELLVETYAAHQHGLEPIRSGGGWILAPKTELWEVLKERYGKKSDSRLSRAALETLSIIAYSQPATRSEIESIRGVAADGMIRLLLEKDLIKEVGKKEAPGRPVQYGTTKEFLKYFRLGSIADLPRLDELERGRFDPEGGTAPESASREAAAPAASAPESPAPAEAAPPAAPSRDDRAPPEAPAPPEDPPPLEAPPPSAAKVTAAVESSAASPAPPTATPVAPGAAEGGADA